MPATCTIFDYNGVLVDDEHVHLEAFREALAPLGVEFSDHDYWERYIGFDDYEGFREILRDAGREPSERQLRELIETKRPLYLERARASLSTYPGAREVMRQRASAGEVVIVSGALREEIELGVHVLGAGLLVGHIVAAEDTKRSKPDPEGYLLALKWLEANGTSQPARHSVVLEDSLAGVRAAKAAGIACVGVAHTCTKEKLSAAGADAVVDTIGEVDETVLDSALGEA